MKILVAVTGASGAIYAKRLLDSLAAAQKVDSGLEVAVCFSTNGRLVWQHELGGEPSHGFREYANDDFACSFASGSALWHAVVAVPCSVGRVGRIASGMADDLIARAADVALKERRKLVLVLPEVQRVPSPGAFRLVRMRRHGKRALSMNGVNQFLHAEIG